MIRALWTSATGMVAQQVSLDVVANNIANVNTTGFKRDRAEFQDLMYQAMRIQGVTTQGGNQIPTGINIGQGTILAAVQKLFAQGDYQKTENELDLAIQGNGFLLVTLPSGETAYTRSGSLKQDSQGRLVTADGYLLTPNITVPQNATGVSVETDGTVSVTVQGKQAPQQIGTIELATFPNQSGLKASGKSLFMETDSSGSPITGKPGENGNGTILQGYLEMSNVNVIQEMVNLIVGQRAYEVNSKSIQAADEMLRQANELKR
jgi:flagellar basal-body rod protein FlgG